MSGLTALARAGMSNAGWRTSRACIQPFSLLQCSCGTEMTFFCCGGGTATTFFCCSGGAEIACTRVALSYRPCLNLIPVHRHPIPHPFPHPPESNQRSLSPAQISATSTPSSTGPLSVSPAGCSSRCSARSPPRTRPIRTSTASTFSTCSSRAAFWLASSILRATTPHSTRCSGRSPCTPRPFLICRSFTCSR